MTLSETKAECPVSYLLGKVLFQIEYQQGIVLADSDATPTVCREITIDFPIRTARSFIRYILEKLNRKKYITRFKTRWFSSWLYAKGSISSHMIRTESGWQISTTELLENQVVSQEEWHWTWADLLPA